MNVNDMHHGHVKNEVGSVPTYLAKVLAAAQFYPVSPPFLDIPISAYLSLMIGPCMSHGSHYHSVLAGGWLPTKAEI